MMKVRFYPKKDIVVGVLNERIASIQEQIDRNNKELAEMEEAEKRLIQDPFGSKRASVLSHVMTAQMDIDDLTAQKLLLESHAPPDVMVEIDL